jgi:NitT/TauT family transport system permease protein
MIGAKAARRTGGAGGADSARDVDGVPHVDRVRAIDSDSALAGLDAHDLPISRPRPRSARIWSATWPKLAAFGLFLLAWQVVVWTGWKPEHVLPGPIPTLKQFAEQTGSSPSDAWEVVTRTLTRAFDGYLLAVVLGVVMGMAVSRFSVLRTAVGSFLTALQTMPAVVWFPLAILLFQLTESAIIFVVVLGATPPVATGVINGIGTVPPSMVRVGRTMGARGMKLYRHVIAPAAMPSVLAGLKQGWVFAWWSLMAGELLVVVPGHLSIGVGLQKTRELSNTVGVIATMITIFVIGVLVDAAFNVADRRMRHHRGLLTQGNMEARVSQAKPRTDDLASQAKPRTDDLESRAKPRAYDLASRSGTAGAGAWRHARVTAALVSVAALVSLGVFTVTATFHKTPPPAPQATGVSEAGVAQAPPGAAPAPVPAGRNLVLIDVSASMGEQAEPGTTWLQAITRAVTAEVGPAPEATEVGVWVAGLRLQDDRDWAEVFPVGPLGDRLGAATRRQRIQSDLGQVGAMPDDRLGLYDTVLAAFRTMNSTYQPNRDNTVIVFTDGRNDDPAGITLENLVATLANEFDPARPVHVNIISRGDGVDRDALTRIADTTRGGVYTATSPQQAQELFRAAMSRPA